ncbi:hypothetical protein [Chitinophaga sp.]|uniref:hypothetical protein n=1 Tax=Chitinophaga sp. TaxID=1869181 RepID=UPI0031D42DDF
MKKIVLLFSMISLFGCQKADRESSIEKYITKRALGVDLKYHSNDLVEVKTVTVGESLKEWNRINKSEGQPLTDQIKIVEKLVAQMRENGNEKLSIWEYKLSRLKYLSTMRPEDIDYTVYKNEYTIINPLLNNAKQSLSAYFIANHDGEIVAREDADKFGREDAYRFADTEQAKYETMMIKSNL